MIAVQYTETLNLKKLELTDAPADITEMNTNWDELDAEAAAVRAAMKNVAQEASLQTFRRKAKQRVIKF